jgi:hypothetical protein
MHRCENGRALPPASNPIRASRFRDAEFLAQIHAHLLERAAHPRRSSIDVAVRRRLPRNPERHREITRALGPQGAFASDVGLSPAPVPAGYGRCQRDGGASWSVLIRDIEFACDVSNYEPAYIDQGRTISINRIEFRPSSN